MEKNRQHNKTLNWQGGSGVPTGGGWGVGGQGGKLPPPPDEWQATKKEREREGERREIFCFLFFCFCLSARILSKIRCGNNVARHKVCAVKITAIS